MTTEGDDVEADDVLHVFRHAPAARQPEAPAAVGSADRRDSLRAVRWVGVGAAALLLAASAATMLVPSRAGSCPGGLQSFTTAPAVLPAGEPPLPDDALEATDERAVAEARTETVRAAAQVAEAEAVTGQARILQSRSDAARAALDLDTAQGSAWSIEQARARVAFDRDAVQWAKDRLSGAAVADAQATLDRDLATLASGEKAAAAVAPQTQAARAAADALAAQAQAATSAAQARLSEAVARQRAAESALTAAESARLEHQQAARTATVEWHHQRRLTAFDVRASNAVLSDCRDLATMHAAVAGGLAVGAVIVLLVGLRGSRRSATQATT
ncbi:hypothetical protein N865_06020 [Intrasporangium oryzae NRRL B-24470]|uniref:Uncharacterized protein n=1 Tax=Intrasporangium oryzae NRRL B-24470 TaxID=1386089 RepID=W9GEU4_9MICO|nr:hypothetical protein N865_06020 [Intrasporangium oryzae NRRL B-24470]